MSRRGIRVIPPLHPPHPGPRVPARVVGPARASACRTAGERDLRRKAGRSGGADGRPARAAARVRQCCCVRVRPVWRAGETGPGNGVVSVSPQPRQSRGSRVLRRVLRGAWPGPVACGRRGSRAARRPWAATAVRCGDAEASKARAKAARQREGGGRGGGGLARDTCRDATPRPQCRYTRDS